MARACANPACGRMIRLDSVSGVCVDHVHSIWCRCVKCRGGAGVVERDWDGGPYLPPLAEVPRDEIDPVACRLLWGSVLLESLRGHFDEVRRGRPAGWPASRDFAMVCTLAGVDVELLRDWIDREERRDVPGRALARQSVKRQRLSDWREAAA